MSVFMGLATSLQALQRFGKTLESKPKTPMDGYIELLEGDCELIDFGDKHPTLIDICPNLKGTFFDTDRDDIKVRREQTDLYTVRLPDKSLAKETLKIQSRKADQQDFDLHGALSQRIISMANRMPFELSYVADTHEQPDSGDSIRLRTLVQFSKKKEDSPIMASVEFIKLPPLFGVPERSAENCNLSKAERPTQSFNLSTPEGLKAYQELNQEVGFLPELRVPTAEATSEKTYSKEPYSLPYLSFDSKTLERALGMAFRAFATLIASAGLTALLIGIKKDGKAETQAK